MFRTVIVVFGTLLSTLVMGVLAIIASLISRSGNLPHRVAQVWAQSILLMAGIRVRVRGLENINPQNAYIYMPNHQSNFDIPVLLSYLQVQFRWLAKVELFRIPLFGYAMKRAGYISIDRSDRKAAFQSLARAAEIIASGVSVVIFPEGTRSRDGRIRSFKKGGFVLAVDAGVPIVPIIIHGTRAIMPKNRLFIQKGEVLMEICPPIDTRPYSRKTKDQLIFRVREEMVRRFERGR
jgi:1-acyl-sn-glycerol-3-phosphate acyltransferase